MNEFRARVSVSVCRFDVLKALCLLIFILWSHVDGDVRKRLKNLMHVTRYICWMQQKRIVRKLNANGNPRNIYTHKLHLYSCIHKSTAYTSNKHTHTFKVRSNISPNGLVFFLLMLWHTNNQQEHSFRLICYTILYSFKAQFISMRTKIERSIQLQCV